MSWGAARWRELSPYLDELLDLAPPARAARLQALAEGDAALADDLRALLAEHEVLDAEGFLEAGALPAPAGLAGQAVGAYTLERLLGEGGMGQVWLARRTDGRFEGQVAIKLLRGGLRGGADRARFAEEGRILARLDHPHIARLLDAGVGAGDQPYLVLEYVDGEPIDRHLQRVAATPEQVVALMIDACDAVAHAHARLTLHRDLKPSNMLVRHDGQLKLLDFGIAKLLDRPDAGALTERVGAAYTPRYAAPEQHQGQDVTTATDVYALGVLLYELLGGGHPTAEDGANPLEELRAAVEREPRRLSEQVRRRGGAARRLRGDLDTIVARALAKQPAARYANAADLAEDLRRWRDHQPVLARPDGWLYRSAKFVRRHRVGVGAAAVALTAVVGGAAVALLEAQEAQARRRDAEGLIEFMLGDLRQRLQPVGRLDVLDAVGTRALAYYEGQDLASLDADALGRRARALHLIGEIAERRGQLDEAARRLDSAAAATALLLERDPADAQRLFDHAQSEFWIGFVARRRGDLAAAETAMRRYVALADRLAQAAGPDAPPEWALERPYAQQNLGVLLLERGQVPDAIAQLAAAAEGLQAVARAHPALSDGLPVTLGWLARAREAAGDLPGAVAAREASLQVLAQPAPGVPDSVNEYDRALALVELAALRLSLGDAEAAQRSADASIGLLQALARRDAANLDWAGQLGLAHLQRAEALAALARPDEAAADVARAGEVLAPLWGTDPDKRYWHVKVRGLWLVARAMLAPPDPGLRAELDAWLAATARSEAARGPLDGEQQRLVAHVLLLRGDAAQAAGEADPAARDWRQAAAQLAARAAGGDLMAQALLAHAHWRLGDAQAAARAADKLATTPYRHPLHADLLRRLGPAGKVGPRS